MRGLKFLIVLLGGLVAAQQQALMDYLERRLLAIEVSLKFHVLPATPALPELHKAFRNEYSISFTNTFSFRCVACLSVCDLLNYLFLLLDLF